MTPRAEAWIRQATSDLEVARLTAGQGFHPQACYHATQAAEKALKALLIAAGTTPPLRTAIPCPNFCKHSAPTASIARRWMACTCVSSAAWAPKAATCRMKKLPSIGLTPTTAHPPWRWRRLWSALPPIRCAAEPLPPATAQRLI